MERSYSMDQNASDEELAAKAKDGDKEAFGAIFHRYYSQIHRYLSRYLLDSSLAEDVSVEVFIKAYKHLPRYSEKGRFSGWLYKIATNEGRKAYNKRKKEKAILISIDRPMDKNLTATLHDLLEDNTKRPDQINEKKELRDILYRMISFLDKKHREPLLLCDVQGLNYDEAARALGITRNALGVRISRARKALYAVMRKFGKSGGGE